jgi:putative ABC transport system substrate-binding protein
MPELGYVEGQNLVVEARWAEDRYDRLPALTADVLRCADCNEHIE